jgi:DNA helicase HerA-like ATPase
MPEEEKDATRPFEAIAPSGQEAAASKSDERRDHASTVPNPSQVYPIDDNKNEETTEDDSKFSRDHQRIAITRGGGPELLLRYANRHGLISGTTGSGKTVSLQVLSEALSQAGVPVFLADVKGDLSGLAVRDSQDSAGDKQMAATIEETARENSPVIFRDVFGVDGHRLGLKVSSMGPVLLSRLLDLSDAQSGVLHVAFRIAQDAGHDLATFDELIVLLRWMSRNHRHVSDQWGAVNGASIGAIQRKLLAGEDAGVGKLFGVDPPTIDELICLSSNREGRITILAADRLIRHPLVFAMLLTWFLENLLLSLPEVGDQAKPQLVFFFDEAHLLFRNAPKELTARIEQTVRLIRSKGVSVWFVTQHPTDIPPGVLAQLGNRILHGLRGFTARDRKDLRGIAESMRTPADWNTQDRLANLTIGEALVSFIGESGEPGVTEQVKVRQPSTRIGPLSAVERRVNLAKTKHLVQTAHRRRRPLDVPSLDRLLQLEREAKLDRSLQANALHGAIRARQLTQATGRQRRDHIAYEMGFKSGRWVARAFILAIETLRRRS